MPRTMNGPGRTYLPGADSPQQLEDILAELEREFRAGQSMRLVSAAGQEIELPGDLFDVLRRVAEFLAAGQGVTVVPTDTQLTTQEAADFIGVSRPTLVKYLDSGALSYDTVGRHRRVMLADLVSFQERIRAERQAALRQLARHNQQSGMLDLVHEPDTDADADES
ncbi:helix-turn-helix domain-containing protein [Microbacterium sp.]|uniref:helix-turn-helix domain-containing protein n=1 Tax=Microbacterium sp. TaxID=51671 RepID=UPI003A8B8E0B